jgi:hypothetical protein
MPFCTVLIVNSCGRNAFNMQHQGTADQYAPCIKEAHSALFREIHGLPFTVVIDKSPARWRISNALYHLPRSCGKYVRNQGIKLRERQLFLAVERWVCAACLWPWEWRDYSEKMRERVSVWNVYNCTVSTQLFIKYRIFRPTRRALSIQKRSKIVKNEHARYTLERFPADSARVICTKKGIGKYGIMY